MKHTEIEVSGPFLKCASPYGNITMTWREWFVSKNLAQEERKTEIQKVLGTTCLGNIVKFDGKKDYVISQLFPRKSFTSLKGAIDFLVENEGKIVFCT